MLPVKSASITPACMSTLFLMEMLLRDFICMYVPSGSVSCMSRGNIPRCPSCSIAVTALNTSYPAAPGVLLFGFVACSDSSLTINCSLVSSVAVASWASLCSPSVLCLYPACCSAFCAGLCSNGGSVIPASSNMQCVAILMHFVMSLIYIMFLFVAVSPKIFPVAVCRSNLYGWRPGFLTKTGLPNTRRCFAFGLYPV